MARNMPIRYPKIPKVQVRVDMQLNDGANVSGHVFVEATVRVQDLLNAPELFFPFIDNLGTMRLINKMSVTHIIPYD